jgi:dephospho-CoA kinase
MIVVGLTGSIAMGKSTVAKMFAEEGAAVFDSDAAVHALYAPGGGAAAAIEAAFPGVVGANGGVDRSALAAQALNDKAAMDRLEAIVHPLVGAAREAFLLRAEAAGADVAVLDIPLLFEAGGGASAGVDKVVVVSAPPEAQRARALSRPGMTAAKLEAILARQLPDAEKRARADFVIDTGVSLQQTRAEVRAVLDEMRKPH